MAIGKDQLQKGSVDARAMKTNGVTLAKLERSDAGKIPVAQGSSTDTAYTAVSGDVTLAATGVATTTKYGGIPHHTQAQPAAKTVTAGITAAELLAGLITTTGATGPSVHQLPTGTEIDTAFGASVATGDAFDFSIINTGTGASTDATITVNTGVTIVGNPTIGSLTDATIISGSGTFRAVRTGVATWTVIRLS